MQKYVNLVDLEKSKMLKNAPTLAIVAVDTAENEPLKISLKNVDDFWLKF